MVGKPKEVIVSKCYNEHLSEIIEYGDEVFGYMQANKYLDTIVNCVERLNNDYHVFPECRHLATKNRIYRNIILDAHLIIYRITDERIEVLDIIHAASSVRRIRGVRKIRF